MATPSTEVANRIKFYQTSLNPLIGDGIERIYRHLNYVKSSKYNQMAQGGAATVIIATSAIACGVAGAKVGRAIGGAVANESGAKAGTGVGFTVGFTFGAGGGIYAYLNVTERSQGYKEWMEVQKENTLDEAIAMKHADDEVLKNYTCPITCFVMLMPCRSPNGHLFESNAILGLPRDDKGRVTCPLTREKFNPDMFIADPERALFIHKRIYELTCVDIEHASNNPALKKLLESHRDNIKQVVEACYNTIFALIEKRRVDQKTTFEQSQQERTDFVKFFGESPASKLDWALDWKNILNSRWVHFYPQVPVI